MSLSPEEKRYYGQLFKVADKEKVGVITGEVAVKFFERSGLPAATLGLIWEISDKENSGFLTQQSFSVALRLIGQAQSGRSPDAALAKQAGPFPQFQGIDAPAAATPRSSAPQPPKSRAVVPPLTPEDRAKYHNSWLAINPSSDILDGERARDVFQKSRLPVEQLGQIWALTDTRQRGALDQTEFIVAMHLVQSMMSGNVKTVPSQLPPGLFESAASGPTASSARSQRQQSSVSSVRSQEPLQQQYSGQRQTVPMRSQLTGPPGRNQVQPQMSPVRQPATGQQQQQQHQQIQSQGTGQTSAMEWDVKPFEKANYDNLFNDLDKSQKGFITGEEAVEFFSQSKLPQDDLAKVWDLSDADQSGSLTKDWFAVAMHLIKGKLGGEDVPPILPASLIPPAARPKQQAPTAAVFAEAQAQARVQPVQPSSAAADLFGLNDSFSAPIPSKSPPAQVFTDSFGAIDRVASPSAGDDASQRSLANHRAAPPPPRAFGGQAAFVPASSFGQSIQQRTQSPVAGQASVIPQGPQHAASYHEQDLLGDSEPSQARPLNNDSTELANMNNQMNSMSSQHQKTRQEREQVEADMHSLRNQKAELTQRLAQIREAYDQEVKTVRAMQVEQTSLRAETRELNKEVSLLEASLDAIRQQHETIGGQLEKDRAENISIKNRIKSANDQTVTLKATLEKVQKEAKQQRGLVAINTKQLNTLEAGHERLNTEIEKEQAEADEQRRIAAIEQERAKANLEQSRSVMISPALSNTSASTNPFHRVSSPTAEPGRDVASPFSQIFAQNNSQASFAPTTSFQPSKPAIGAGIFALGGAATAVASISPGHDDQSQLYSPAESHGTSGPSNTTDHETSRAFDVDSSQAKTDPPRSTGLSGFDHAFGVSHDSTRDDSQAGAQSARSVGSDVGSKPEDQPRATSPGNSHRDTQGAGSANQPFDPSEQRNIVSPVPVTAHAQAWSDADPFTADVRVVSPAPAESTSRPMPAAVASLAISSNRSDDGSVGTSVQAQAPASYRETPVNSRPTTPTSQHSASISSREHEMESATKEHELSEPVSSAAVQHTMTSAPHNDIVPVREDSPAAQTVQQAVPGAFPTDAETRDDQQASESSSDLFHGAFSSPLHETYPVSAQSQGNELDEMVVARQDVAEVESSDDETIEQPRGADFFSNNLHNDRDHDTRDTAADAVVHNKVGSADADSSSTHTVTRHEDIAPTASTQSYSSANTSNSASTTFTQQPTDEFDEFDDLEEATEADDEDEMGHSFTTTTNDFDASFDAPQPVPGSSSNVGAFSSTRQSILTTPLQMPPGRKEELQASPARDFSEFAHYGAVLGEPSGLAPPIRESEAIGSFHSTRAQHDSPFNQHFGGGDSGASGQFPPPAQGARSQESQVNQGSSNNPSSHNNSAPTPPASRHGATLSPVPAATFAQPQQKRPEPARAISAADDPMLTELTDMGFERSKSVGALERFNYDLGAAMDWLLKGN